ncbi:hypothetical protein ACWESM_12320 [Nocardia sp. NPDC003999]
MAAEPLRVVADGERVPEPLGLLEAVKSGDVLAIMKAQRQIIAESLVSAQENTRPQYSNELNKLNKLIAEEEERRGIESGGMAGHVPAELRDPAVWASREEWMQAREEWIEAGNRWPGGEVAEFAGVLEVLRAAPDEPFDWGAI